MKVAVITGSAGLIGSEAARFFSGQGYRVVGVDNNMRKEFFGAEASTEPMRRQLEETLKEYTHVSADIRDYPAMEQLFNKYGTDIQLVIHTAAQPSHDWAAGQPHTDFSVNALGTLNILEATRAHCPRAVFIFTSTNKVYGDEPNRLPLVEQETRWEIAPQHRFQQGIDETMSIDQNLHSLFGVSKAAADLLVQEYGKYFGMKTGVLRGGCLTGRGHAGTMLHGFLSYLMKCAITGTEYTVIGYKGKQVRDNIHSSDLVNCFHQYSLAPRCGEVYNMGGSRHSNCSMQEAVRMCEEITGKKMNTRYRENNRIGDHIWYISDVRKFKQHFPAWEYRYDIKGILSDIYEGMTR